ncbi:energy transducer TonB [Paraburkholderia sp. BL21I4N1]|uniref:energy transducer TonB n=1 Tax=Paraburkholderia sp. BL21I4N1 TaxID=1938801 RepID=UPI000CFC2AAF|nr:energy transducer TonB [Paraburkholderia sp. BL21I4N1]PQV46673.1 outer membrane transport energization protein TonB [Paraburkholderia sp. BL21I4N1]
MSAELISPSTPPLARPPQYGRHAQHPLRRYAGLAVVLLLHLFFIWALMNGLANKVVQIVQKPIETRIIMPVKPPPPPPVPTVKLAPPKVTPPPPPFVPPPEVVVAPTPPAPTITHQAVPEPTPVAAPPAPVAPPAPAPVKPVSHTVGVVCPNSDEIRRSIAYPQEAQDNNITGDVTISFVVDPQGHVTDEKVEQSADPILDRAAFVAVKKFNCISQGQSVRVQVPFSFNLN